MDVAWGDAKLLRTEPLTERLLVSSMPR
jgi:hypothetical protein